MLAGATGGSEEKGRGWEGSRVRLMDFNIGRLSGLKYKLVCCFKLMADMLKEGIR